MIEMPDRKIILREAMKRCESLPRTSTHFGFGIQIKGRYIDGNCTYTGKFIVFLYFIHIPINVYFVQSDRIDCRNLYGSIGLIDFIAVYGFRSFINLLEYAS